MPEHIVRAYYRIRYPIGNRPTLVVGTQILEVFNVAEFGLGFLVPEHFRVEEGQRITGKLNLGGRAQADVDGDVVWIRADMEAAAVKFRTPIPFGVIMREQRYLRSVYKLRNL